MNSITCYNCEEEFRIEPVYESEAEICFCPYCGSELDLQDFEEEFEEDLDELDKNNWR